MAIRSTVRLDRAISSPRPARVAPFRRPAAVCSNFPVSTLYELAAGPPGSVDAPIGVVIAGAVIVTIAATAIIPLWLNPGQQAADKIFQATQKKPLDKKKK